jgi:segregation and condensation protein B
MSELKNQVESLLFSAGKRLTLEELGRLCKEENLDAVKAAVEILKQELDDKQSSLMLVQEGEAYKLTVREKYISMVKKVVTTPELPKSIMETLAVVAYKAPVMQSQVIKIRTNKAYRHLEELEEMGYITREKKGRSRLIKLTPKFFDYFDVPPDKLKEKFHNVAALEKAIEEKETAIAQTQQAIYAAAHDNKPKVEAFSDELPTFAPEIEVIGDKVGSLETYGEAPKPKKKHKHKKHAEAEEEPKTPEEAAEALAEKILAEAGIGTPEATEEETAEMEEEGRLTVEKIKKEAAKEKPRKSEYTSKGMFPSGMPEEVREKVEHRVAEMTGQEKAHEEETDESAEMGMPDVIPAPEPMTEAEETAAEAEEEVKSEQAEPELNKEEEEAAKEVEEETPAQESAEEGEKAEEPAEKEPEEEVAEEEHEAQEPEERPKKHKKHH